MSFKQGGVLSENGNQRNIIIQDNLQKSTSSLTVYSNQQSVLPVISIHTQSWQMMCRISELFNELTLTNINDPIPLIENKLKVKELKQAMDGLL